MSHDRARAQIYLALTEGGEIDCSAPASRLDDEDLAALVDGTLSADRRRALVGHLATCSSCCHRYADVREAVAFADPRKAAPKRERLAWFPRVPAGEPRWSWLGLGAGGVLAAWAWFVLLAPSGAAFQNGIESDLRALGNIELRGGDTLSRGGAAAGAPLPALADVATSGFLQRGLDAGYAIALPSAAWSPDAPATGCIEAGSLTACGATERRAYEAGLWLALTDAWCSSAGEPGILERQTVRLGELRGSSGGALLSDIDTSNTQTLCAGARRIAAAIKNTR